MKRPEKNICAYCHTENPETRDHIPPQSFFPRPKPSNLITVPCCEGCRVEQSQDDEYFRLAIVSSSNVSDKQIVQPVMEAIHRSLRKPNKVGFSKLVNESLFEMDVHSKEGIYLGKSGAIKIDKARFDRVAERVIRGLFFHELGFPLPIKYKVTNIYSQFGFQDIEHLLGKVKFEEPRVIGKGVFWYTYAMTDEDPNSGVWLQKYYEGLPFIGFTTDPSREK